MRKHNIKFARRWGASSRRAHFAHEITNNKEHQLYANILLCSILHSVGSTVPGAMVRKRVGFQ